MLSGFLKIMLKIPQPCEFFRDKKTNLVKATSDFHANSNVTFYNLTEIRYAICL